MFYCLRGELITKKQDFFAIDVNGIGFKVLASEKTLKQLPKIGTKIRIFCAFFVKKDTTEIYGFLDENELEIFETLISVSGIGPKSALSILGKGKTEKLMSAIVHGKADILSDSWGVGRKKAERIILELKGKIKNIKVYGQEDLFDTDKEVKSALKNLGYRTKEIEKVLEEIPEKTIKIEERLKAALKFLSKK